MSFHPLAFDRTGAGPPLVLVHPLGADRGAWAPVLDLLGAHHDVIAIDLPGFGGSSELPAEVAPTPAALGEAVAATLASVGVERAHLAGISLGGWVALELAKTARALSVTAINPAGFWGRPLGPRPEVARNTARRLLPLLGVLLRNRAAKRAALAGSVHRPERVPYADALRIVRSYATAPGFSRANHEMRHAVFTGSERIRVPVTLAWAEHDRLVRRPRVEPPGATMVDLPGVGHVPTWDDPELIAKTILATASRARRTIDAPATAT